MSIFVGLKENINRKYIYMDKKKFIEKTLNDIRKKTNFNYQRAITRNINNPTTHAQHKELQNKKKSLSNDRFIQYLKEISKADND